jgi:hypothetical protein
MMVWPWPMFQNVRSIQKAGWLVLGRYESNQNSAATTGRIAGIGLRRNSRRSNRKARPPDTRGSRRGMVAVAAVTTPPPREQARRRSRRRLRGNKHVGGHDADRAAAVARLRASTVV